jgi:hypothetical protein
LYVSSSMGLGSVTVRNPASTSSGVSLSTVTDALDAKFKLNTLRKLELTIWPRARQEY